MVWYVPQLGAPIILSRQQVHSSLLNAFMSEQAFMTWGWRIPFISSAILGWSVCISV